MFLGIEIGGTKLQIGIGPGDGTLEALWRGEVNPSLGGEGIRRQILSALPELFQQSGLKKCHLHGVGIGFGGPVDDHKKTVIKSHQIEGWDDFPLADWVSDILDGLPVALGNDADVAGLAEALFGAGKGFSPIFYITIGSGIGGGLIIDGEIYRGSGIGAAEIGHLLIHRPNQPGQEDILESFSSGWGIGKGARVLLERGEGLDSLVFKLAQCRVAEVTARHVGEAAAQGDPFAQQILQDAWRALAVAINHVLTLLCPQRIVIGGGVSLMGEKLLFHPLRELVAKRVFKPFRDCYEIVPAALGEAVVVQGALALARKRFYR